MTTHARAGTGHELHARPAAPASSASAVSSATAAESVASAAVLELRRLWCRGERPLAESLLNRCAVMRNSPEEEIDVIYEEYCLRTADGEPHVERDILGRFPQWSGPLEVMFACHRVLQSESTPPDFPAVGDTINGFRLTESLGQGARGRVYLATQSHLSGRQVVLKLTPLDGAEHLVLASLQHTSIVPVYAVDDDPVRNVRSLCMPYFGRATLATVLSALAGVPVSARTGGHIVTAIDELNGGSGNPVSGAAARQMLLHLSYVQAVTWIVACLADGLQYAHERSLLHLDVKPSNVLLGTDGQPMLLDFHLAREPVRRGGEQPDRLGGTPGYMPPEQLSAMQALSSGQPVNEEIDARADVFAIGAVLQDLLSGTPTASVPGAQCGTIKRATGGGGRSVRSGRQSLNGSGASKGLADVIAKCLAPAAVDRYPSAAALAEDLRRHLADQPLVGVRNRSLTERWQKWRRRKPGALSNLGTCGVILAAVVLLYGGVSREWRQTRSAAVQALIDGQRQLTDRRPDEAVLTFERGLSLARSIPSNHELHGQLETHREGAMRQKLGTELMQLADRLRGLHSRDLPVSSNLTSLAELSDQFWQQRRAIAARLEASGSEDVTRNLLDLAIFRARLQRHLAPDAASGRRESLLTLDEAAELFGDRLVLDIERRLCTGEPIPPISTLRAERCDDGPGENSWEHYALGRALLEANRTAEAESELDAARRLCPEGVWPNFCYGLCAHRLGRSADAIAAFSVCIGADPGLAAPYYNRAACYLELGNRPLAARDFARAHDLDPSLAPPGPELSDQ